MWVWLCKISIVKYIILIRIIKNFRVLLRMNEIVRFDIGMSRKIL